MQVTEFPCLARSPFLLLIPVILFRCLDRKKVTKLPTMIEWPTSKSGMPVKNWKQASKVPSLNNCLHCCGPWIDSNRNYSFVEWILPFAQTSAATKNIARWTLHCQEHLCSGYIKHTDTFSRVFGPYLTNISTKWLTIPVTPLFSELPECLIWLDKVFSSSCEKFCRTSRLELSKR